MYATWEVLIFIVIVSLDVIIPAVAPFDIIELTIESFATAVPQFSDIIS